MPEIASRTMPVNEDGYAIGATAVTYATGLTELYAYYATCSGCRQRHPFFSPADREGWVEAHRASHPAHPVQLSVEPWDYTTPPWIAAYGLPLTTPWSTYSMSTDPFASFPPGFPRPDYDQATLDRIVKRRAALQAGCPIHPGARQRQLTFYKELVVGEGDGVVHMPTMATYADGCLVKWRLDVEDEEPVREDAPV